MNCDRFNLINDSLGHAAGDAVLNLVAQRLRAELRTRNRTHPGTGSGPVAARNGGDTRAHHTCFQAVANSWWQCFFVQRKLP